MITQARLKELLSYDPATGVFIWKVTRNGKMKVGLPAGSIDREDGYVEICLDRRDYKAHRLAWLYVTGAWPVYGIDHIDRDKTNNRFINLRDVPHSVNLKNRVLPATRGPYKKRAPHIDAPAHCRH